MSEYTADDFRTARFAEHPDGMTACRIAEATGGSAWTTEYGGDVTDRGMAADGWVPVRESAPVSLDALRTAWENAGPADECRKGDVLIRLDEHGGCRIYPAPFGGRIFRTDDIRVLSRAPQREPWQDLEDAIRAVESGPYDYMDIEALAYRLHERGVRVTGGDDDA